MEAKTILPSNFPVLIFEMIAENNKHLNRQKELILKGFLCSIDRDFDKKMAQQEGKTPTELHIAPNLEKHKEQMQYLITTHVNTCLPDNTIIAFWPPTLVESMKDFGLLNYENRIFTDKQVNSY